MTYAQGYLQQGRYAEAIVSTGAEPDLIDRTVPPVTFQPAGAVEPSPAPDTSGVGGMLLFDADRDGDLDLLAMDHSGTRLLQNTGGRLAVAPVVPSGSVERRASAGDYDNDGRPDLFVVGETSSRLLHRRTDGRFEDVTRAASLPADFHPGAAAWVDVDHDGDVDLVTAGPVRLLRNNGNGTFADITRDARLEPPTADSPGAAAVIPTDYDNRRDVDLLIVSGGRPKLFRNMRDGTFVDVTVEVGLPSTTVLAAAAADVNKDGFVDFLFTRAGGAGILALSDGRERFVQRDAAAVTAGALLTQFFDYDNDGLLDIVAITPAAAHLLRNLGDGWSEVSASIQSVGAGVTSLALGDIDGDGDTDVITWRTAAGAHLWRNEGGNRHKAVAVTLAPRVSNRSGLGAKVEIRAGSVRQLLETSAASPAVGPADLLFGLGVRGAADVVRVLWPSGILQTELAPGDKAKVEELDRKPSSCPFLYTWNGSRFEFVTDFLGGEMGDWIGPGQFNLPDPDEYVRITGDQLQAREGRYEIRVTNELEEAMFLDRARLLIIDHPADVDVYPNEGLKAPPRPAFRLFATRGARVPARAEDEHGHDVRSLIARRDRQWPDDFGQTPIRGYASPHSLTLDFGADADRAVLLLTGWTGYAFSSDNVAASQAGLALQAPVLQMRDRSGAWIDVDRNLGFPVGRPQTIAVDLAGKWLGPAREVRLLTNMPIYWDQILVATAVDSTIATTTLESAVATLRWRGFSAATSADGREPFGADYHAASAMSPWKTFPGAYTREGDVRALLERSDDMFVIARPGDEIALSFDAAKVPPIAAGHRRTFLLYADGFSKEMNISSATPDSLGPLPFHAMSRYPYGSGEEYPRDRSHRDYRERYNTRIVPRLTPSIDAAAAGKRR